MEINKFGGASVKDANAVRKMFEICRQNINTGVIVVSAMGKNTNLLEKITLHYFSNTPYEENLDKFKHFHLSLIEELSITEENIEKYITPHLEQLSKKLSTPPGLNYDFEYDQIVPFGELLSTSILAALFNQKGYKINWIDIRTCLKTDSTFRDANINWELSASLINKHFPLPENSIYITQGFIGADINNQPTTLGREGSDFTAAVLANILNAHKVTVWKDVPGIMTADPAWLNNVTKVDYLSYYEAIELTYFGAKVIHPKTIKPLRDKNIPLHVRSFIDTNSTGTIIGHQKEKSSPPAVYIRKENQVLISISPNDLSFIVEENLSDIFGILSKHRVKVNLMQNSAMKFAIAVDGGEKKVINAITELKEAYNTKYNDNLEIITIRHPDNGKEKELIANRTIYLEQRTRTTVSFVVK
jgi:aspartate kinase